MTATAPNHEFPSLEAAHERAMGLQIEGRLDLAEPIYRSILQAQPLHAGAHYCLGMLLVQQKRVTDGSPHLLAAVNSQPQVADYWLGYLEALLLLGDKALATEILGLARQHGLSGRAVDDFAQRLQASNLRSAPAPSAAAVAVQADITLDKPAAAGTSTLRTRAEPRAVAKPLSPAAERRRSKAIERQADAVMTHVSKGRCRDALPLARAMTERYADCGIAWKMLGAMLWATGNELGGIEAMQTSVRLLPDDAEAHKNLAAAINKRHLYEDAENSLRRALQIDPNYAPAHLILGHNYQMQGRYAEARACLDKAIALQSDSAAIEMNSAQSLLLFVLNNDPSIDAPTLFQEHCKVGALMERAERTARAAVPLSATLARRTPHAAHDRNPDRPLEIGFVSADYYNHSVSYFLGPLLSAWQGSKSLEVTAYYVNQIEDTTTERLRGYVSRFVPVMGLSNTEFEALIVKDRMDILIDLSGHTALHRLGVFARKPAPLQASWLGYPSTTGLSSIDYYLADKHFLPPGEFDAYFTEKLVYLPSAWPFQASSYAPPVNRLPALDAGYLTFGSFNRIAKINEPTVRLWSQLLRAVPGSKMLIAGVPLDVAHRRMIPWFAAGGIGEERLSFYPYSGQDDHFALHHRVDIGLEPMPYSGCTTSNHALWMGVPSLTCVGTTPASRLSAANLGQLGLEEFIATSEEDFIAKGIRWAGDLPALARMRETLRAHWQLAPARNPAFVAAGMELALRRMWQRWCAGLPAESFEITAEQAAAKAAR